MPEKISETVIDDEILRLGEDLHRRMEGKVPRLFNKNFWQGRLMERMMEDSSLRTDLLRFIDVLPALKQPMQVSGHVREYFLKDGRELPGILSLAVRAAAFDGLSTLGSATIKKSVAGLAGRFIVGKDIQSALPNLADLHKEGMAFTADLLGEATVSYAEADVYRKRYLDLIDALSAEVEKWNDDEMIDGDFFGPAPRANISLKVSAMDPQLDPVDTRGCVDRLKEFVLPVFLRAKEKNVFINVDLEQWELHGITYDLFEEIAQHPDLRGWPHIGIVVQAYLKKGRENMERLLSLARARRTPFTIRLVKGAYWDFEIVSSRRRNLPCPVYTNKAETDAAYENLTRMLLENAEHLHPAFGSHNHRSLLNAMVTAEQMKLPANGYEIQMLYGMAEPEREAVRAMGRKVRVYTPIGELLPGIGYLVRRILENTSNISFLRLTYKEEADIRRLLSRPEPPADEEREEGMEKGNINSPFENSPLTDFRDETARKVFASAVGRLPESLPLKVPVVVAGRERFNGKTVKRFSPAETGRMVAEVAVPTIEDAKKAAECAMKGWPEWRDMKVEKRAALLEKVADRLESDRLELAALEIYEVGKPWREADADVAEAIDFCRYYARRALPELAPRSLGETPGEKNIQFYEGRGPTLVIAPWNFPAAILTGMTAAALVAGNSVIMKPSGKSCGTAWVVYRKMISAGIPPEILQFLPGAGETVGDFLAGHPLIAQIAFTGSSEVGLSIVRKGADTKDNQPQVRRFVCEMGGKNAIIVDEDADPDEAVLGVIESSFGYAGQKCSACSRVIVVGRKTYEQFTARLAEACKSVIIAPAHRPECRLGPVIDEEAFNKLRAAIEQPGDGATPLYLGEENPVPKGGYYIPPAIFEVHDANHTLMQRELFGPVVAVMPVKSFDEALKAAISTRYALTGGVYSRSPGNLEKARKLFRVGNLYFNRAITGALVNRQPFGGFGMSGIGTKAGGPGYLKNFAEPRTVTENSMRHGFTPEIDH